MTNKKTKEQKELHVRPSEFYWALEMLLSMMLIILYYVNGKKIITLIGAIIIFIMALLTNHNKKISNKFDYKS